MTNETLLKPRPIMHTLSALTCIAAALVSLDVGSAQSPEEIDALIAALHVEIEARDQALAAMVNGNA